MSGIIAAILAASIAHTPFTIGDNGGALATRQPLAVHQVVFCGGVAETVQAVRVSGGIYEIRVTPAFPAKDAGKLVVCWT